MALIDAKGDKLGRVLCEALGLDPDMTKRIVLDVPSGGPVVAYVEQYASSMVFEIDWSALLGKIQIAEADK